VDKCVKIDLQTSNEVYKKDLKKRPTKKTTKKSVKIDLHTSKEAYKKDLFDSKEIDN